MAPVMLVVLIMVIGRLHSSFKWFGRFYTSPFQVVRLMSVVYLGLLAFDVILLSCSNVTRGLLGLSLSSSTAARIDWIDLFKGTSWPVISILLMIVLARRKTESGGKVKAFT